MPAVNEEIFKIEDLKDDGSQVAATVSINKNSKIFQGHFPGQAVVPGACMLQLVKDVLEGVLTTSILLKKAGNLKFISMIDPAINTSATLDVIYKTTDGGDIGVNAKLSTGDTICFKFQGDFIKVN